MSVLNSYACVYEISSQQYYTSINHTLILVPQVLKSSLQFGCLAFYSSQTCVAKCCIRGMSMGSILRGVADFDVHV